MKLEICLDAKCRNCIHWEFETLDGSNFLEDNETYCKLDNLKRKDKEECNNLKVDLKTLKDNLLTAGFKKVVEIK